MKDSPVLIEMLQLRLQYEIKVKLNYLDSRDSFYVHRDNEEVVVPEEFDNLSYLLQKILPMHNQRVVKRQFEKVVPDATHKLKSADVLNKLQPKMVDVKMCASTKNILDSESDQYNQFKIDM